MTKNITLVVLFTAFPLIMGAVYPIAETESAKFFFKAMTKDQNPTIVGERELYSSCSSCSLFDIHVGSCGIFSKNTDKWCNDDILGEYCCAESEDDCCEANPGAIFGIVLALLVLIGGIVIGSCACCSCCMWHDRLCCAKKRDNEANAVVVGVDKDSKPQESSPVINM